jgi:hypothetical protein
MFTKIFSVQYKGLLANTPDDLDAYSNTPMISPNRPPRRIVQPTIHSVVQNAVIIVGFKLPQSVVPDARTRSRATVP